MYLFGKKYRTCDDYLLVKKISSGDESALREILSRYKTGVFNYALKMTGIMETAEDITQETFISLYRISENLREETNIKAYIYKIARNKCIDLSRKKKIDFQQDGATGIHGKTPYDELRLKEDEERLMLAISELPENQKTALLLRHTEGFSYREISRAMGLSVSAVESLLVRAKKKLKKLIQDSELN